MDIEDSPVAQEAPSKSEQVIYQTIVKGLLGEKITTNDELRLALIPYMRRFKLVPNKLSLCAAYKDIINKNPAAANYALQRLLIKKAIRSDSGILNISVSLPPDRFSCKYNCHFCPNEPGMPRSYLSNEDVFMRASAVDFDTVKQVYSRLDALTVNGHPIDKLEFRVLGGTFSCYDHDITDAFVRDLYYAANTYFGDRSRTAGTIEEEQAINIHTQPHVVGLGVETRPDEITPAEVIRFRRYGVTRVELGIQHTDDALLRRVNRGHGIKQSKAAIKLLKDYGFKLELHIMTDLPGATPEGDKECYRQVLRDDPDLIPDYMKDYPCLDVTYTKIKEWKEDGRWTPYSEKNEGRDLVDVLVYRQQITPPWVRVNRIQRDFKPANGLPGHHLGFTSNTMKSNLAQIVKQAAEDCGIYCQCIRCCEVRDERFDPAAIEYTVQHFTASGADEYFISASVQRPNRPLLLGFLRLRISDALKTSIIAELRGATAMIRELHVYGKVNEVNEAATTAVQHRGIGKRLLKIAEDIACRHQQTQIAVISGIGVRGYYAKQGYVYPTGDATYMIKQLSAAPLLHYYIIAALLAVIAIMYILIQ
jgi:ELP3 family radical SAM enzyme/protein acetyltransferase